MDDPYTSHGGARQSRRVPETRNTKRGKQLPTTAAAAAASGTMIMKAFIIIPITVSGARVFPVAAAASCCFCFCCKCGAKEAIKWKWCHKQNSKLHSVRNLFILMCVRLCVYGCVCALLKIWKCNSISFFGCGHLNANVEIMLQRAAGIAFAIIRQCWVESSVCHMWHTLAIVIHAGSCDRTPP